MVIDWFWLETSGSFQSLPKGEDYRQPQICSFFLWWWPICVYICVADKCDYGVRITFAFFFRDVSSMGLIAMVAECYIAIAHSLKYVRVFTTTRRTFMIIAICWVIPFLFNAFFLSKALRNVCIFLSFTQCSLNCYQLFNSQLHICISW